MCGLKRIFGFFAFMTLIFVGYGYSEYVFDANKYTLDKNNLLYGPLENDLDRITFREVSQDIDEYNSLLHSQLIEYQQMINELKDDEDKKKIYNYLDSCIMNIKNNAVGIIRSGISEDGMAIFYEPLLSKRLRSCFSDTMKKIEDSKNQKDNENNQNNKEKNTITFDANKYRLDEQSIIDEVFESRPLFRGSNVEREISEDIKKYNNKLLELNGKEVSDKFISCVNAIKTNPVGKILSSMKWDPVALERAGDEETCIRLFGADCLMYVPVLYKDLENCIKKYPLENNRNKPILKGDLDGDGKVTSKDLSLLERYLSDRTLPKGMTEDEIIKYSDITGDGVVDERDFYKLREEEEKRYSPEPIDKKKIISKPEKIIPKNQDIAAKRNEELVKNRLKKVGVSDIIFNLISTLFKAFTI